MKKSSICAMALAAALWGPAALAGEPGPFESQASPTADSPIDKLVLARLKQLGIAPAKVCSDSVFVRRVYLDVIGTLPTAEEVKAFLSDENPNKRRVLIDGLLDRSEFADYWALKWSNVLRIKGIAPINLWPRAAAAYHRWVHTCIRENMAYDQFVREMLTSSGSNMRDPQVNFYRALSIVEPASVTQAVALTFMGERVESWTQERREGMTAFFQRIGYKSTLEWKEEIVFFDRCKTDAPASAVFPDGTRADLPADKDPRRTFADWLITPRNPWFARNIANRAWAWLQGRGIVHEPDDIRPDNPPSNPELLALLEKELIESRYDLKRLYRFVLNSQTYQLSSISAGDKPGALANFAHYPVRQLEAEILIDALNQLSKTGESYGSESPVPFTVLPPGTRAIQLGDATLTSSFLELFGRSEGATGRESDRGNAPTGRQQMYLLNSRHVREKMQKIVSTHAKGGTRDLYLSLMSRYPTDAETKAIQAHIDMIRKQPKTAPANPRAQPPDPLEDVVWALVNSAEFLNRH